MRARNCSLLISERATPITAKGSGSTRPWNIDQSAGTSLRLARSPEAPKITRVQESSGITAAIASRERRSQPARRRADQVQQLLESRPRLVGQVQPHEPATGLVERVEVAERLGGLEGREAVPR